MNNRKVWVVVSVALCAGSVYLFTLDGAFATGSAIWLLGFGLAALRKSRPPRTDSGGYSMRNHWLVVTILAGFTVGLGALFLWETRPIRYFWLFGSLCGVFTIAVSIWVGLKMRSGSKAEAQVPSD